MTTQNDWPRRLLLAAEALLEAREDDMVTDEEWSALAEAVKAARRDHNPEASQRDWG